MIWRLMYGPNWIVKIHDTWVSPSESLSDNKTKYPSQVQIIKPPIGPSETLTKYIPSVPN